MKINDIIGALKTPISFFTGNKVTIALIVIIFALIAAFSVTVIIYTAEIKSLKAELKTEKLQSIFLQDSLEHANSAIDKQNKAIDKLKIEKLEADKKLKQELDNISLKRQSLIKQAEISIMQDNSCYNQLSIINNTQMEFLNGK